MLFNGRSQRARYAIVRSSIPATLHDITLSTHHALIIKQSFNFSSPSHISHRSLLPSLSSPPPHSIYIFLSSVHSPHSPLPINVTLPPTLYLCISHDLFPIPSLSLRLFLITFFESHTYLVIYLPQRFGRSSTSLCHIFGPSRLRSSIHSLLIQIHSVSPLFAIYPLYIYIPFGKEL